MATQSGMGTALQGCGGSWVYTHEASGLRIKVRGARLHSDGRLTAKLRLSSDATGLKIPGSGVVNISAPGTRSRLAKDLEISHPTGVWEQILDDLYLKLEDALLEGEPAEVVTPTAESLNTRYLVEPILPADHPTILYGLGGVGKGWLALLLAKAVVTGDVPRGLPVSVSWTGPVLYLDWEDSLAGFRSRWTRIVGTESRATITYRRCTRPLAEELDYIGGIVNEVDPVLVEIDSAGLAAGGDLNTPESALSLFRAIRALQTTTLVLAHAPKNSAGTVFGSAFYTNLARSVWEVRSELDTDTGELVLGVAHRKSNVSRLHAPFGISLSIGETVQTRPAELAGSGVAELETVGGRIRYTLRQGAMAAPEIADATGISRDTVRRTLNRLYSKGQVLRLHDGRWAARGGEIDDAEPPF